MYFVLITVAAGVCLFYYFMKRSAKPKSNVLPGPKGLPFVGCAFEFNESTMPSKLSGFVNNYGDIFQIKMFQDTVVVLNTAESIKKVYTDVEYKKYMNDRAIMFYGEHFRSKNQSVTFSSGEIHAELRNYFHKGLHTYGSGLLKLEDNVLTEMESLVNRIDSLSGQEFCLINIVQRSLSNVISLVMSGEPISDDDPDVDMFWEHVKAQELFTSGYHNLVLANLPFLRFLPGLYRRLFRHQKELDEKIGQRYLYQQKETYVQGKVRGLSDFYIDLQQRQNQMNSDFILQDHHIISQFAEVVDAGMTTSSAAILNSFAILMNYPECQRKIQAELDSVIGRDRFPTFSDRLKCQYLKAFEMEVHRYIPVLPLGFPHLCNQDVTFEGFNIQRNSIIMINNWHLHHEEKIWGDPWNFRPERFLDEDGNLLPKSHELCQSLLPFGVGPRICPGQVFARTRYFLYLASLLQRWNFEFPPNQSVSCDPRNREDFESTIIIRVKSLKCIAKKRV